MGYDTNTGPTDMCGVVIKKDDLLAVGTNSGIRIGKVVAVKTVEHPQHYWDGRQYHLTGQSRYTYSITINRILDNSVTKRQTFNHDVLGAEKFWVIDHRVTKATS